MGLITNKYRELKKEEEKKKDIVLVLLERYFVLAMNSLL